MGLRPLAVVLLAGWTGWLLFRGVVNRRVPWIGLALLAVPMLLLGLTERQWTSAEHEFSAVARTIAPASSGVHCQRLGETFTYAGSEVGSVWFDESGQPAQTAMLSYETCQRLSAWWRSTDVERAAAPLEQVVAVHTLSHEAVHLTGERSEALTECRAVQLDEQVALTLGASPSVARAFAVRYVAEVYPRLSSAYVTGDCAAGARLDLTPEDQHWP